MKMNNRILKLHKSHNIVIFINDIFSFICVTRDVPIVFLLFSLENFQKNIYLQCNIHIIHILLNSRYISIEKKY